MSPAVPGPAPSPRAIRSNPLEDLSIDQLRSRTSMKWRAYPEDVLPLWVAEMDVALAPAVAKALHAAVDAGDTGYPTGPGYAEAVQEFASKRWGWHDLAVERTALVPDVMMGVTEALRLLTSPGDAVVVCAPVYPPFYAFTTSAGRRVVEARLDAGGRIDLASLERAFLRAAVASARTVLLLSNPHNPTGVAHTRAELEAVAALSARHGVRVVSDEIHAPLVLPGAQFTPYLSVAGAEDALSILSASKAWNLAGLKAALLVAGPEAERDLRRLPEEVSHGPSHLGVMAHTAAFRDAGGWLDDLLAGLAAHRDLLADLLREHLPLVGYQRPEATYLAWLDCRLLGFDGDADRDPGSVVQGEEEDHEGSHVVSHVEGPAAMFLDQGRVALSSGHVFGSGGRGFVRLNFATSAQNLQEAVRRMGQAAAAAEHLAAAR